MIGVGGDDPEAVDLVAAALRRSVSTSMVTPGVDQAIAILVSANPRAADQRSSARKLIVFGALPEALAHEFGFRPASHPVDASRGHAEPAPAHESRESPLAVSYGHRAERLGGRGWRRPFLRYDFADEWNNLGFGAIRCDDSIWALGPAVDVAPADEIAAVTDSKLGRVCSYAALCDRSDRSILWFNRPVGPLDSVEWRLVENFLSAHRADELPVVPVLSEIPAGHDSAIVARLDCDEDIETARLLWSAYRDWGLPLSLAIHTKLLAEGEVPALLSDAAAVPGSILSHSATHAANWGGSYDAALGEANRSADAIAHAIGTRPRHAVSPFHQSPAYALKALRDAGYAGCCGGNISADPAFNLARGGALAGMAEDFVGQTGQCMLHGDCMLDGADPLAIYRQAFDLAFDSGSLFGYLDHPFSSRYQYGWSDEAARIATHRRLVDHIVKRSRRPVFLTGGMALDFLLLRAQTHIVPDDAGFEIEMPPAAAGAPRLALEFRGRTIEIANGTRVE